MADSDNLPASMPERQASQTVTQEWEPIHPVPIDGVRIKDVKNVVIRASTLTEIYRPEWFQDEFVVQHVVHISALPGYATQWHCHHEQTDIIFPVRGYIRIGLYDARKHSPSCGKSVVLTFNLLRPRYVVVPPGVWHALRNIGVDEASYLVLNDKPFHYEKPDDWLLPAGSDDIPVRLD